MGAPTTETITVFFISNEGGGYADELVVPKGTTIQRLVELKMSGQSLGSLRIRVNRETAVPHQVLSQGDRVSVTPTSIKAAA